MTFCRLIICMYFIYCHYYLLIFFFFVWKAKDLEKPPLPFTFEAFTLGTVLQVNRGMSSEDAAVTGILCHSNVWLLIKRFY